MPALSLCACCRHYPGAATGGIASLIHPVVSAFPERVVGSACASAFSRLAQRSLALRPAHSRCHQFVARLPEGFSHFVTFMTAPVASGWSGCRMGLAPTGKAPPYHGAHPELPVELEKIGRSQACYAATWSHRFSADSSQQIPASARRLSPARCSRKCRLQHIDVDLDNLHHRVRRSLGLGSIGLGHHLAENGWDDLPREAQLCTATGAEEGNPKGRGQESARSFDSRDPRPRAKRW